MGDNWEVVTTRLPKGFIRSLNIFGNELFIGTNQGVFLIKDEGTLWNPINLGLNNLYVYTIAVIGSKIFAGTNQGLFVTSKYQSGWSEIKLNFLNPSIYKLYVHDSNLFVTDISRLFKSSDEGNNWTYSMDGILNNFIRSFASLKEKVILGTDNGVYISEDIGVTWKLLGHGFENKEAKCLSVSGDYIYTAASCSGIWKYPITGITKILKVVDEHKFSIIPNPSNGQILLNFINGKNDVINLQIMDLNGRVAFKKQFDKPSEFFIRELDLSTLSKREYTMKIEDGKLNYYEKFIIK